MTKAPKAEGAKVEIERDEVTGLALTGDEMDAKAKADAPKADKADKAKADEAKAKLRKNMAATSAVCPVCGAKARYACRDLHVTKAGSHFLYKCPKGCAFGSIGKDGSMADSKPMTVSYQTAKVPTVAPEGWLFVAAEPTVHIW